MGGEAPLYFLWAERHYYEIQVKANGAGPRRHFGPVATLYSFRFRLVDNILEMKYIEGVFGEMARNNFDLQFFLEVKSNLTKQQIKLLAHGGANVIQPGIESFSMNQLMEMDKGVRPLQNILCMKWAMY